MHEKIVINDDIEITVVAITGNMVRLGIQAPKEVPIVRKELIERDAEAEGRAAS
jgi:carbon storage regulator